MTQQPWIKSKFEERIRNVLEASRKWAFINTGPLRLMGLLLT